MIISNYFYCVKWAFAKVLPKLMLQLDAKPPTHFKPNVLCNKTVVTCQSIFCRYHFTILNKYSHKLYVRKIIIEFISFFLRKEKKKLNDN